jgi:hypothetical protein
MGQQQSNPSTGKVRVNVMYIVLGIAVVAIVVLAALAAFFYQQAQDYRGSKYRAQYVLVEGLISGITGLAGGIDAMANDSLTLGERTAAAYASGATDEQVIMALVVLSEMYHVGEQKFEVFDALATGFHWLAGTISAGTLELEAHGHDLNQSINTSILNSVPILHNITQLLSAGIEIGRDYRESPYHVVALMDLDALAAAAQELNDAQFP